MVAITPAETLQHGCQSNLAVDLRHTLKVCLGCAFGAEDNILTNYVISIGPGAPN